MKTLGFSYCNLAESFLSRDLFEDAIRYYERAIQTVSQHFSSTDAVVVSLIEQLDRAKQVASMKQSALDRRI